MPYMDIEFAFASKFGKKGCKNCGRKGLKYLKIHINHYLLLSVLNVYSLWLSFSSTLKQQGYQCQSLYCVNTLISSFTFNPGSSNGVVCTCSKSRKHSFASCIHGRSLEIPGGRSMEILRGSGKILEGKNEAQ